MFINVKLTRQENCDLLGLELDSVAKISFEDYVAGVVASEVGNSDVEVCKAQAIAARTFAVNKGVLNGKTITDSSSSDQAFRMKRIDDDLYPNAIHGAEVTSGKILTYNDKPIAAVYSACNGGHTVSAKERWGSERKYLPSQEDPWDDSTKRTGHGVGMSQRGAKAMAKVGKTCEEILAFYYPYTTISTIEQKEGESLVNAKDFIAKVAIALTEQWGYIYGCWHSLWTKADQDRLNKTTDSNRAKSRQYGSKWIGHYVTDCSGLVYWAMHEFGVKVAHHATYLYTDYCKNKGKLSNGQRSDGKELQPGSIVFIKGSKEKIHHVGVYIGDDTCIEAKGAYYGVVTSNLSHWEYWGELKAVDYTNSQKEEAMNMDTATVVGTTSGKVNMRKNPRTNAGIICKIPENDVVVVLDKSNPEWYQVEYTNHVGWVMTQYLKEKNPEPVEEEIDIKTIVDLMRASLEGLSEELEKLEAIINKTVG